MIESIKSNGFNLAYDSFAAGVNDVIGEDRNVQNFKLVLYLSRRVIINTRTIGSQVKDYFRVFIPTEFAIQIARMYNLVSMIHV